MVFVTSNGFLKKLLHRGTLHITSNFVSGEPDAIHSENGKSLELMFLISQDVHAAGGGNQIYPIENALVS